MSKDFFELPGLEDFDSLLSSNINESSEVNVPDGGDKERPSGVPGDVSIKVPAKVDITAEEYNNAIAALKRSYKESIDVLEILENSNVTHETIEDKQKEFNENAIADALYEAYVNGPVYEAVAKDDKGDIKGIINTISKKIDTFCKDKNIKFKKSKLILRFLADGNDKSGINKNIWQVLGLVYVDGGTAKEATAALNKEFAEDLGKYKILSTRTPATLVDLFASKFGWKNTKSVYTLVVDTKLPSEFKESAECDEDDEDDKKKDDKKDKTKECKDDK